MSRPALKSSAPYGGAAARAVSRTSNNGPTLGLPLNKKFGQHLLKNPGILDKIVDACDLKSTDTVLEIGPGTGNLTVRLCRQAKKVIALDIDPRMAAEVTKRCQHEGHSNMEGRHGDALRADLPAFDVCAANMPYQISSPFVFRLLAHRPMWRCAVLMFQKEFAERLIAEPNHPKYSRLAVNTRLFCKVTSVCKVAPGSFNPPPQVDSMVVRMVPRETPIDVNFREWDGLMRICFTRKRKTMQAQFKPPSVMNMLESNYKTWCSLNNLAPSAIPMKSLVEEVLEETQLAKRRPITIDIDEYMGLLLAFNKRGIRFVNVAQHTDENFDLQDILMDCEEDDDMDE